ncbi:MAG: hypothetical protein ACOYOB_06445 [Myxococcota bacterium]
MTVAIAATPRKRSRRWLVGGVGLVVAVAVMVGVWTGTEPAPQHFSLDAWTPRDAGPVAWLDELAPVARGVRHFVDRVPGARGVQEALALTAGLDVLDPAAVEAAGFRMDAGLVGYRFQNAVWLVLPVRGPHAVEHLLKVLRQRGYEPRLDLAPLDGVLRHYAVAARGNAKREALHLWQLPDAIVTRWHPGAAETPPTPQQVQQLWHAWRISPRLPAGTLKARQGEVHVRAELSADGEIATAARAALGPANLLVGSLVDRARRVQADLRVDTAWPELRVVLQSEPGATVDIADYHFRYLQGGPAALLDLGDLLPDETVLLARTRLNPLSWKVLPAFVQDRVLPASLLSVLHPALSGVDARTALLGALDGQLAAGLLGVADEVPLDPRAWTQLSARQVLRGFVAVSFTTDTQALAFVEQVRAALGSLQVATPPAQFGRWTGLTVDGPEAPWWLLRDGRKVVVLSGQGVGEDLARTAGGKFPTLGKAATGELEQALVQGKDWWTGASAMTPRIARSLRRRGVPDHFVQMLSSLAAVSVAVKLGSDGVEAVVQLRPAELEVQPATPAEAP